VAGKDDSADPEALVERARQIEMLSGEGLQPFSMQAELELANSKGSSVKGDYSLDWESASRWREDIRFSDYERLRVGVADGYWQKSGLEYQPAPIFVLDAVLQVKDVLKIRSTEKLTKVKQREKNGLKMNCTDVKGGHDNRTLCFDNSSGALESVEYSVADSLDPHAISRIEYGLFTSVAGRLVPFEVRAFHDHEVIASEQILKMEKANEAPAASFAVPANSEFWAQCEHMQAPKLTYHPEPEYPVAARRMGKQGAVRLYAVIETDGSVSHLRVIQTPGIALSEASVDAVRRWRYQPAMCGQTPVRLETYIDVIYSLRW
jgi:protein TonB